MLAELLRAVAQLRDPRVRSVLWLGIGVAVLTFVALAWGAGAGLDRLAVTGYVWADRAERVLGTLGGVVIAWFLFPGVVVAVSSLFLDRVVDATEARYRPDLPRGRDLPLSASIPAALRLLGATVLLNLLALPLYLVPGLNLPVWLALNGYLVGREYFELVALRRLEPEAAARLRRARRGAVWATGLLVAFLLTVPLVNLLAPVLGAAFMAQRYHRLGAPPPLPAAAGGRRR